MIPASSRTSLPKAKTGRVGERVTGNGGEDLSAVLQKQILHINELKQNKNQLVVF